jgi:hypothetical protein
LGERRDQNQSCRPPVWFRCAAQWDLYQFLSLLDQEFTDELDQFLIAEVVLNHNGVDELSLELDGYLR